MELKCLRIVRDGKIIRTVDFRLGLNLVMNRRGVGRSGNSVGKSTLPRIVDFLFMGPIDPIYIDEEFGKANQKIENLFTSSVVEAELDFVALDGLFHRVSRNLSIDKDLRSFYLDGKAVSEAGYEEALQLLFFKIRTKRPSIRFVAPKFIRNDTHKMLNTTKFLDPRSAPKDYSELFLYLFGFENTQLLTEKRDQGNLAARRKKQGTALNAIIKEQKPSAEVIKYRKQALALEEDILRFEYSPGENNPVGRLTELQDEENRVTEKVLNIHRRLANVERTVSILNEEGGNHLVNEVRAIYQFAGVSVETALRSFEEVLAFHDKLVAKKLQFISEDIPELHRAQRESRTELDHINAQKAEVFSKIRSSENIAKITENIKELGRLKVELGKLEGLLEQQKTAAESLRVANLKLQEILAAISLELTTVEKFIGIFNKHFAALTTVIHNDPYLFALKFDSESGACEVDIENSAPNPEGGKKKAEVMAFDMAYILTVAEIGADRPSFVFHDGIEDIDQKQIADILKLAENLPGQQIISMLSDKLEQDFYDENLKNTILLLSDEDMFFAVN